MILSLNGRKSNNALLCRTLGDWISTKEYKKNTCGGVIIRVTSPVCIREIMQRLRSVCKKPYTEGSYAVKITKQMFDRSPMVFKWGVYKLGEFIHGKGNIRSSHPGMLKATNHLTVRGGIDWHSSIMNSQRSTYGKRNKDRFGAVHVMFAQEINDILLLRQ